MKPVPAADVREPDLPAICARDLTLGYDRVPAVHHLDLEIGQGALVALVGTNGAGKSTLLKAMAGILRPMSGGLRVSSSNGRVGYLPQATRIDLDFPIGLYDFVATGLFHEIGHFGGLDARRRARIEAAIAGVGLTGFERRTLGTLSGGQFQRALFARLVVQDANLVLLDEPFTGIDADTLRDLCGWVARWHEEGRTVIAALHDLDLVRQLYPEVVVLARDLVAHGSTCRVLTKEVLERASRLGPPATDARVCRRG